jgi:hypothetical protein
MVSAVMGERVAKAVMVRCNMNAVLRKLSSGSSVLLLKRQDAPPMVCLRCCVNSLSGMPV